MSFGLARGKQLDITGFGILAQSLPPYENGKIDPRAWFPPDRLNNPFHIEIGSGKGTFLVQQATATPNINYLGIEWAGEFFRYAADRIRRHNLQQVRILRADAVEFIRYYLPDQICAVLHIYFPDPWPKKRHHKRRSINAENLKQFHRILKPQGEIRIVTDHDDYWQWIQQHITQVRDLFTPTDFNRPESANEGEVVGTNFERKYRRENRPFHATRLIAR